MTPESGTREIRRLHLAALRGPDGGEWPVHGGQPGRQRANLDIFGFCLSDAEMAALAVLDLGEDAAVDSDERVEF